MNKYINKKMNSKNMTSQLVLIVTSLIAANNASNNTDYLKNYYLNENVEKKEIAYEQGNPFTINLPNTYAIREEDLLIDNIIKKHKQQYLPKAKNTTKNNKYIKQTKTHLTRTQYK
jgi:hypothetical protein